MKIILKLIFFIGCINVIFGMRMNKNSVKVQTGMESLTFYQMALHAKSHGGNEFEVFSTNSTNATENNAATSNSTASAANSIATNVVGGTGDSSEVIVDKSPWEITKCDQVLMVNGQRINNHDDYTSRSPAFFTLSAYLLNMFESKDSNKLLESINLGHIKQVPSLLKGSKNCAIYIDGYSHKNVTFCSDDMELFEGFEKAYNDFMTCRRGGDLKQFDPVTINNVLTASCNGFNNTSGVEYDMPAIRTKMANELKEAGFDVTDTTTSGTAKFGVGNSTTTDTKPVAKPRRKVDLRVPGTH